MDQDHPYRVVGVGLNAVDFLCVVPRYPAFNSKVQMVRFLKEGGGQVATAMVALQRLGIRSRYVGKFGDDELGRFSLHTLQQAGVDISQAVVKPGVTSQFAVILVDQESGERTIVWQRPGEVNLKAEELDRQAITSGEILLLDGYEIEAALQAALWAKEAGMRVVLDLDGNGPNLRALIRLTDVVIAAQDAPARMGLGQELQPALVELAKLGPALVVATLGKEGAIAYQAGRFCHNPGFSIQAVDTTGAGDVFHAGFVYGMLMQWELEQTMRFANAFAALKCLQLGGRAGIAKLEDLSRFLHGAEENAAGRHRGD